MLACSKGEVGERGEPGIYFAPSVDENGILTWINNGDAPNPSATSIKGQQGIPGEAATIEIGTIDTGEPGTDVVITNSGTSTHAVLNITIPRPRDGIDGTGAGDMVKAVYDANSNGVVDNAEKLGGKLPDAFALVENGVAPSGEPGQVYTKLGTGDNEAGWRDYSIPENVLQYTEQDLTDQQKQQARANIGAVSTDEVALTKDDIGLDKVDNTSDIDKPISTATQAALDNKSDVEHTHDQYLTTDDVFDGDYNNLTNKPAIPTSASQLGAVSKSGDTMTGALTVGGAALATRAVRNAVVSTVDLTPGVSALQAGDLYFVYEVAT